MAKENKSAGLTVIGRTSNWYEKRSRQQLLAKEKDHGPYSEKQVDEIIIPTLEKQGRKLLPDAPALQIQANVPMGVFQDTFRGEVKAVGGYPPYQFTLVPFVPDKDTSAEEAGKLIEARSLPEGIMLTNQGTLEGFGHFIETREVTVKVIDGIGQQAETSVQISIQEAPKKEEPVQTSQDQSQVSEGAKEEDKTKADTGQPVEGEPKKKTLRQ